MFIRLLLLLLAALTGPTAGAQPPAPLQPAPITWNLATGYRAESFQTQNLMLFAEEVQRSSLDALRIAVHPNNALFMLRDIFSAVETGRVEAGETILTAIASQVPIAGVDGVPFIVSSYDDARRLWAAQRPALARQFAARGLHLLYAVPWPPQGLFTHKPVGSTADLKDVRMRTFDPTTQRIAQLVGAVPVDVAMVDLRDVLAQGSIDAMISSTVTGSETQAWSRMRLYYSINAFFPKNAVFVSSRAFLALPPAVQVVVETAAQAAEARGWTMSQSQTSSAAADLKSHGMVIERPSAQLQAELKRLGEQSTREWLQSVGHEASAVLVPYLVR